MHFFNNFFSSNYLSLYYYGLELIIFFVKSIATLSSTFPVKSSAALFLLSQIELFREFFVKSITESNCMVNVFHLREYLSFVKSFHISLLAPIIFFVKMIAEQMFSKIFRDFIRSF